MEPIAEVCCQDAKWASDREIAMAGPGVREGVRSPSSCWVRGAVKGLGDGAWGLSRGSSVEGRDCLGLPPFPGGAPQTPSSTSRELGCVSPAVPGLQVMVGRTSMEGLEMQRRFKGRRAWQRAPGGGGNLGTQGCICKPPGPPSRLGRWCLECCTQSLKSQVGDSPLGTNSFPASPVHVSG